MAEQYYIGKENWQAVLKAWLDNYTIIAPFEEPGGLFLRTVDENSLPLIITDRVRTVQPLKNYFLPPIENVSAKKTLMEKPWMFLGIKACDLAALHILDQAYGGVFADPAYQQRRETSIIVSADCNEPSSSCFCTLVGGNPYPERGFDLNLSRVWEGFVVEIGSLRGRELLDGFDRALKDVVKEEARAVEKIRMRAKDRIIMNNRPFKFPDSLYHSIKGSWDSAVYKAHTETCVECGACNHACPTCHCYTLEDATLTEFVKMRGWDSCQYSGYAVTAGGGTPRPRLFERLRNRYFCKFKYLYDNYDQYGCTGCGRCIDACQGRIDMREVISDIVSS